MKNEIINITPAMATKLLDSNIGNRPLRKHVVHNLKCAFMRGEYTMTHQGIAFGENGRLLDGQHRLTAISQLAEGEFPMLVTTGLDDEAFKNIDGVVRRTPADALREDKSVVEAARLIAVMAMTDAKKTTPTVAALIPFIDDIYFHHSELMTAYAGGVRTWSSASVRVAAILSMRKGIDIDYVKSMYRTLCTRDIDAMPSIARSLFKAEAAGTVKANFHTDMIARSLSVFDPKKANNRHTIVLSSAATYALIRSSFSGVVEALALPEESRDKKVAAISSAAKGIPRPDYRTATR